MNARLWPDTKAVIVIEINPEHEHLLDAIEGLQRFLSAHRLNAAPEDQMFYGPTLHVAIKDVAEAVLEHFESAPLIDEEWSPPPDARVDECQIPNCGCDGTWHRGGPQPGAGA